MTVTYIYVTGDDRNSGTKFDNASDFKIVMRPKGVSFFFTIASTLTKIPYQRH